MEMFCNVINVFIVTFDEFNAFLLNTIIIIFNNKKTLLNGNVSITSNDAENSALHHKNK